MENRAAMVRALGYGAKNPALTNRSISQLLSLSDPSPPPFVKGFCLICWLFFRTKQNRPILISALCCVTNATPLFFYSILIPPQKPRMCPVLSDHAPPPFVTGLLSTDAFNLRLSRSYQSWVQGGLDIVTQAVLLNGADNGQRWGGEGRELGGMGSNPLSKRQTQGLNIFFGVQCHIY